MERPPTADRLATLESTVAALQSQLSEREVAQRHRRTHPGRRVGSALPALALALLLALLPVGLFAASPFTDLTGGPHDADIDAIYNAGITKGCVPNQQYCPTDNVTRQEMASFLARTAGLGSNPPVTNARTVGGYAPDGLVRAFGASNTNNTSGPGVPIGTSVEVGGEVVTVPFTAPAAGYVLVTASQVFFGPTSGCPCTVGYNLRMSNADKTEGGISPTMAHRLLDGEPQSGTVSWVFQLPEAGAYTFTLYAYRIDGTATIESRAALSGLYVPFGSVVPLH